MKRNYSAKSRLTILTLLMVGGLSARAQNVGIGTTAPDVSAALDIVSSSKGTLLPRMTQTQRNAIGTPATGLLIFQTDVTPGFYYNAGTPGTPNWQQIATAAGAAVTANNGLTKTGANIQLGGPLVQATNIAQAGNAFSLTGGNVGIGLTTPAQLFDVNGTAVVRGSLGVGNTAPQLPLDVIGTATGSIGFRNGAAWDHLYMYHDGSTAVVRAGGAETGLSLQVGVSATGTYGDVSQAYVDVMRLMPTGRVGIGIATPSALLDVNGSTRLRGLTTAGVVTTDASGNLSSGTAASLDATTASNGLTLAGNDVRLGGTLTGATTIAQAGFNLGLTGGNFGVGTAAPTSKAQVNLASDAEQGLRVSDGTTASNIVIQPLVGGNSGFQAINYNGYFSGGEQRYNTAKNRWRVGVDQRGGADLFFIDTYNGAGSTPLAILPNGNVGLGLLNPGFKLHVQGDFRSVLANGAVSFYNNSASGGTVLLGAFDGTGGNGGLLRFSGSSAGGYVDLGQSGAGDFTVNTASGTRLTVQAAGNVGIGTTTPTQRLHVVGNALISGLGGSGTRVVTTDNNGLLTIGGTFPTGTDFIQNQNAADQVANFRINGNGSALGNFGIGTSTPGAKLDVNGGVDIQGANVLEFGAGVAGKEANAGKIGYQAFTAGALDIVGAGTTNANRRIQFYNEGGAAFNGNVGIGTAAPGTTLDVNGTTRAATYTFPAPAGDPAPVITARTVPAGQGAATERTELILFHSNDNANGFGEDVITLRAPAIRLQTYNDATVSDINNNAGSNDRLYVAPAGNVGIGTSAPTQALHVVGNTRITGLTTAGLVQTDAAGNLSSASTASFGTNFIQNQNAADQVANFRISGNGSALGNFGVGTSAPSARLEVQGGSLLVGGNTAITAPGAHLQWNRSGFEGETWLINQLGGGNANAGIRFGSAAAGNVVTEWARFNNGGNFGIGTTAPGARLDVAGGGGGNIDVLVNGRIRTGDGSNAGGIWLNSATTQFVGQYDATTAGIYNNGAWRMYVANNGNVGIGALANNLYGVNAQKTQLTADGDGQGTTYAYRTRDSQNDGTAYAVGNTNSAAKSYNFWGDLYTFGSAGFCDNDFNRTGGVLGAQSGGAYWGSLGYKASNLTGYGVYGSAAYNFGGGRSASGAGATTEGIGLGAYGGALGGWVRGEALGLITSGTVFATYNAGDVYTSGRQAELVTTANGQRQATYTVSSAQSKVYEDGVSELQNGRATIAWPEGFAGMLGAVPVVTVTPIGECQGLHIVSLSREGFTVAENGSGTHSLTFTWIAVGKRVDVTNKPVPAELLDPAYDTHLKEVMVNDNDASKTALPLWHDGQRTQFSPSPSALRPVVKGTH